MTVEVSETEGMVVISVEDNGPGFKDNVKPFVQFGTTTSGGLGLGLSICKSLVEANSGTIVYSPERDTGARFIISLPGQRVKQEKEQNV